tara:strand:+ start:231 stop:722 length:492 start_codon:yes stop_codon:yes gene_type:complete
MLSQKTMFLAAICFESYKYVNASCIVMPNEISYAYGTTCKRKGFPDNLRCPYDYPYAEQILRQTVLFYGRSTTFDSCHSTKVCCENTYDDGVPDNPIKVKELYQDIKYSTLPKDQDKKEKMKEILEPPVVIAKPRDKGSPFYKAVMILLIMIWSVVGIAFCRC